MELILSSRGITFYVRNMLEIVLQAQPQVLLEASSPMEGLYRFSSNKTQLVETKNSLYGDL